MATKNYEVSVEIGGPLARFSRPDTGDMHVSYPVPTWSAARTILHGVLQLKSAIVVPSRLEICKPLEFAFVKHNYRGINRADGATYQLRETILVDVLYKIHAKVIESADKSYFKNTSGFKNGSHSYYEQFIRRLRHGRYFYIPSLGCREYVPNYFGACRPETKADESISMNIGSLYKETVNDQAKFITNARIVKGVLSYVE